MKWFYLHARSHSLVPVYVYAAELTRPVSPTCLFVDFASLHEYCWTGYCTELCGSCQMAACQFDYESNFTESASLIMALLFTK
jgi:hypothetical protein